MGGPALLQQLNTPIELGQEPQHVILQSAQVIDGIHSRIGVNIRVLAHNKHPVYVLLELIERLEHLGIGVLLRDHARLLLLRSLRDLRGLKGLLGLLRNLLLRWIWDDRWNGEPDTQTTHQIIDCRANILCEYGGIGLLLRVGLLIGVLLRNQEGIGHIKYAERLGSLRRLRRSWGRSLWLLGLLLL